MAELLDEMRPLGPRADDGHVAAKDVPELRQLVDVRSAQEPAERRHPRIVGCRPHRSGLALRIIVHRSELDDGERLAVQARALLAIEHRPAGRQAHDERDDRQGKRQQRQGRGREDDVEPALDDGVQSLKRDIVDVDHRQAVEVLEPRSQRDDLQQIGHDFDVDALAAGALDEFQHVHVLLGRKRDV